MVPNETIALVTGANRGIGLEIARQLARRGAHVILTARIAEAGKAAADALEKEKLAVRFHPLDVSDEASIATVADFLQKEFGRLDVLINNAGIFDKQDGQGLQVKPSIVRNTLETNTLGPLLLAQTLAPLLKRSPAGRVVNMSSGMGSLDEMSGGYAAYRISKTALNAVTKILAAELKGTVAVNSMCPGWVKTDMGGANAEREVDKGAETAVWLALDAPQTLTGEFLRDRKKIAW